MGITYTKVCCQINRLDSGLGEYPNNVNLFRGLNSLYPSEVSMGRILRGGRILACIRRGFNRSGKVP